MIKITLLGEKDHGKSTLLGRLLYETKSFPQDRLRTIKSLAKNSKKRFEWAHLLDTFRYEREKEMTLDTTRATAKIGREFYEFIDVPGHKELIKNMLSGASDAEFGILVIAASQGITKQTLEHLEIAKFLRLKKIIVAINKIDKIKHPEKIIAKIKTRLGTEYIFIPISAYSGKNMDILIKEIARNFDQESKSRIGKNFVAVVQDIYGKNVALKILEGKINKGLVKYKQGRKRGDIISNKKIIRLDKFQADCIFVEKPKAKNLTIEVNFKEVEIRNMKIDKSNSVVKKAALTLADKIYIYDKFVIKNKRKIVGLCRI